MANEDELSKKKENYVVLTLNTKTSSYKLSFVNMGISYILFSWDHTWSGCMKIWQFLYFDAKISIFTSWLHNCHIFILHNWQFHRVLLFEGNTQL